MGRHCWWAGFILVLLLASTFAHAQPLRRGRVVTPDGKPVVGAKVILIDQNDFRTNLVKASTVTDADGLFGFSEVPQYPDLLVQTPGYAWSPVIIGAPEDEQPPQSKLMPATALRVNLVGPDGQPAAGVRVSVTMIRSDNLGEFAIFLPAALQEELVQVTNALGECTIDRLPQTCVIRLDVLDDRYAKLTTEQDITLSDKPESEGGIIKLSPAGTMRGRVVFGNTGRPAAGVRVAAQGVAHNQGWDDDVTDADGRYLLKQLIGGSYNVVADPRGELRREWTVAAIEGVQVRSGENLDAKEFSLITGGLIRGRAYIAGTNKPVPDLGIGLHGPARPRGGSILYTQTAADGTFELRVPPGQQHLYVAQDAPAGLREPADRERDVIVADGQVTTADFVFSEDPNPSISGLVVDVTGKPVSQAVVMARFQGGGVGGNSRQARTDADGRFTLPGVPNGALIRASKGRAISVEKVVVDDTNRILGLTVRENAHSAIRVRVLLENGSPAAAAPVHFTEVDTIAGMGYMEQRKTDADGVVLFTSLDPLTRYDVHVSGEGFKAAESENVPMFPGQTTEITLTTSNR